MDLIEVRDLSKSYGPVRALDRVSFSVREGEIMGFLGPNGAGKSTVLRILAGFLPGDSGTVRVAGHDVARESVAVRRKIGYLPEGVPLYPEMRVSEYLKFRARVKGVPVGRRRREIERSLESVGVSHVARRIVGTLSRGYQQRVGLADTLLSEPRVLILDEPTVGLDPEQVRHFRAVLRQIGVDRTVILSTHILGEVELVCSKVVIIANGRIAATDTAERLRSRVEGAACVVTEVAAPRPEKVLPALRALPGVSRVVAGDGSAGERGDDGVPDGAPEADAASPGLPDTREDRYRRYRVYGRLDEDLREHVFETVSRKGWKLRHLEREVLSLEDVFLGIVGKDQ